MSIPEVQNPTEPPAALPCAPRRKRRRTPATGAANDCFTCSSQNARCDRKRPYCTPCLDRGKDCAGYKTTLTWGVGVASRGKLRGLSLPIAGNRQKPLTQIKGSPRKRETFKNELPRRRLQKLGTIAGSHQPFSASQVRPLNDNPANVPSNLTWQSVASSVYISVPFQTCSGQDTTPYRSTPDSPLNDSPHSSKSDQPVFTPSAGSIDPYGGEEGFRHPAGPIGPSKAINCIEGFGQPQKALSYSLNAANLVQTQSMEFWSSQAHHRKSPIPIKSIYSDPGQDPCVAQRDDQEQLNSAQPTLPGLQSGSKPGSNAQAGGGPNPEHADFNHERFCASPTGVSIDRTALTFSPFSGVHTIGKTPRMQYLIHYYSEVISPVIVAFDGPTNPYRHCILRLASGSETLQHAISALSASNLRQRRESGELSTGKTAPARRSSMAHLTLTDKACQSALGFLSVEDQRKEENYHKNATVHLIQRQFADPSQHRDDSVLATLLIVCLFHICESGVAKFRTHFAGAKKLLGMRESGGILKSKEAKWFTRMFTWFDAMTATVNDREGQMQDGLLDLSSLTDEDWTLENLAGCDGKLFKIIAKLSHLNILSHNSVHDSPPVTLSCSVPVMVSDPSYWHSVDNNGWTITDYCGTAPTCNEIYPDANTQYGREWHGTRNALMSWTLDTSPFSSGSPDVPALTQDQQLDLLNVSESFRFSALIYMERLALPHVSSCNPRIQSWVQKALYFIRLVRSDVYLLWPLFVTGSECVMEDDRQIIRQRCLDIQKDSGFSNNASCLMLLEKIWMSNSTRPGNTNQPSGFRWRSVMESNVSGGEYIVV